MQGEILIVGLGNSWRGDDGAGVLACRALARRWQRCDSTRPGAGKPEDGYSQSQSVCCSGVRLRFLTDLLDPFTLAAELTAAGSSACLVLDAVMAGLPPGELVRWELGGAEDEEECGLLATGSGEAFAIPRSVTSLHGIDLVAAWQLVQATTCRTATPAIPGKATSVYGRLIVWGIQADPGCLWGRRLSPAVRLGFRSFVGAAWGELRSMVAALADGRDDCLTGDRVEDRVKDLAGDLEHA